MSAGIVPTEFETLVGALWADLGLGTGPRGSGPARLTVDGQRIALARTPDERSVLVAADLGPLAEDRVRAEGQLRALLRDGAGHVLGRAAAVRVVAEAGAPARVLVEAVSPCRRGAVAGLVRAVEDVLALAEQHGPTVSGGPRPSPAAAALPADDHLIFRL